MADMPRSTVVLPATDAGLAAAAALLREGGLVAFGTETVYGLGARADRDAAVAAIYAAKGRPAFNPLICHYPSLDAAAADVVLNDAAVRLAAACWPGPLTMVLPRRPGARISAIAAGGMATLAIRVPGHLLARRLLAAVAVGIAAPSANPSGRISPTTAAHVLAGLGGRIDAVLDCGPCTVGLESTVVDLSMSPPVLLRQGGVVQAQVEAVLGTLGVADGRVRAPGQLCSHYAPMLKLRLNATSIGLHEALLAFGPPLAGDAPTVQLSWAADVQEAARNLFGGLRLLDQLAAQAGRTGLAAMPVPELGLGAAINDRLRRAAA